MVVGGENLALAAGLQHQQLQPINSAVADAVVSINASLEGEESSALLEQLNNHYGGLENVQEHEALQYLSVMRALKAAKAEVGINRERRRSLTL